jgi:HSP20 family molecular chaperone IbpA
MMIDKAERMHRRFFELLAAPKAEREPAWEPPANIVVTNGELEIFVALPGADPNEIAVRLVSGGLQIDARVSPPTLAYKSKVIRLEIPYGFMRRLIELPPAPYTLVERRHSNGYLYLRLTESRS